MKVSRNVSDVSNEFHDIYKILVRAIIIFEVLESFHYLKCFDQEKNDRIQGQDA